MATEDIHIPTEEPMALSLQAIRDTLQTGFSEVPGMGRSPDCPQADQLNLICH